jgi:hypothetical protein
MLVAPFSGIDTPAAHADSPHRGDFCLAFILQFWSFVMNKLFLALVASMFVAGAAQAADQAAKESAAKAAASASTAEKAADKSEDAAKKSEKAAEKAEDAAKAEKKM